MLVNLGHLYQIMSLLHLLTLSIQNGMVHALIWNIPKRSVVVIGSICSLVYVAICRDLKDKRTSDNVENHSKQNIKVFFNWNLV